MLNSSAWDSFQIGLFSDFNLLRKNSLDVLNRLRNHNNFLILFIQACFYSYNHTVRQKTKLGYGNLKLPCLRAHRAPTFTYQFPEGRRACRQKVTCLTVCVTYRNEILEICTSNLHSCVRANAVRILSKRARANSSPGRAALI